MRKEHKIHYLYGIFLILFICLLVGVAYFVENWMPTPLTIEDEYNDQSDRFIAERAKNHLKALTDLGPRVVGSYENEVLAIKILEEAIQDIILSNHEVQSVEYDLQVVSGSYYLAYKPYGSINAYANLQNVVVKVSGTDNSENSLLINAHFDTVVGSPGGSDDGINCAIMLEVLRKVLQSNEIPRNNVVFLFNGGEESNIQASHGFITQHRWAKDVKVVINLEATGAGGKEILFQAGPDQAWLMKYYSRVPYPFAHVAGEEIFKSNIIPSDSDFRIFRDFGDVIGYDFAYIKDGYRYHTKYDGFDNIDLRRYQRAGDNILRLVQELADAPEVANPKGNGGGAVFYDILGLFMVYYEKRTEMIINVIVIVVSIAVFLWSLYDFQLALSWKSLLYLALKLCGILLGWILSFAVMALIALFLDGINRTMSWYKTPVLVIGLYSTCTAICCCAILMASNKYIRRDNISLTKEILIQIHLIRLIWTVVIIVGVSYGIKSVYLFMIPILFNTVFMLIIHVFKLYKSTWAWILVYLFGEIVPTLLTSAVSYHILSLFIPICGRNGSSTNPEFMIGAFTVALTILIICYYLPLLSLSSREVYCLMLFGAVFVASIIVVFTPIGFPYSGYDDKPTPQRFPIFHTRRIYHDESGETVKDDSGFYFRHMDYNSPRSIENYVPEMKNITSLKDDCEMALFCGLPVTNSRNFKELQRNSWIPMREPIINDALPSLTLNSIQTVSSTVRRYNFTVDGPDCMDLYFSPKDGVRLLSTNLISFIPDEQPLWNNRQTLYILYVYGKESAPLNFYIDFDVPQNWNSSVVDVAITGKYVHYSRIIMTDHFRNFLEGFPDWTVFTNVALPLFLLPKEVYPLMFLGAFFIASIIIVLTPMGFPYSGYADRPTPQRFPIFHTRRIYHNEAGEITKDDSGFYFRNMDYNSPKSIENYVSELKNITSLKDDCELALFCGVPVTYSRDFEELEENSWIPAEQPIFNDVLPSLEIISIEIISNTIRRYYFTATGPDCMDLYFSPKEGVRFSSTNLNSFMPNEQPLWNNRPTLYILSVYGKESAPLNFYIDFELPQDWNSSVFDVAITGKYIHEASIIMSDTFKKFLEEFPEWTVFTTVAIGYYESWIY